jgi:hypothetical protein
VMMAVQNLIQLYWPEDDPLRSKHVAKLKIQHLLVVLTAIYICC